MKCLIVYFSVTGTTEKVTEAIGKGVGEAGYTVEYYNLKDGTPPDLAGVDLLGIGTPVYYYRMPFNVAAYIDSLPEISGLPVFNYYLHGSYAFDTGAQMRQAILRKGATEAGTFHCHGNCLFLGYLKQGFLTSPDHPSEDELLAARNFGYKMGSKKYSTLEEGTRSPFVYRFERFATNRWLAKNFYSRFFKVGRNCNGCGLCVRECPTQNISMHEAGRPKRGRNCLLCLTCELKCPREAVFSPLSWPVFIPFLRYNVTRVSRDETIAYTKVRHSKGKVTKVE